MAMEEWTRTEEYPINDKISRIFKGPFPWSCIKELQKKLSKMVDIQKRDSASIERITTSIGKVNIQELRKVFDETREEHRERLNKLERTTSKLNRAAGQAIKQLSQQIREALDETILFLHEYNLKMGNVTVDIKNISEQAKTTDQVIIDIEEKINDLLAGKIKDEQLINNINQEIEMLKTLKNEMKELKSELSTVKTRLVKTEKDIEIVKELVDSKADMKSVEENREKIEQLQADMTFLKDENATLKKTISKLEENDLEFQGNFSQLKSELQSILHRMAGVANPRLVGAEEAFAQGKIEIASALLRPALEDHLRQLCIKLGCLPKGKPSISELNEALYRINFINSEMYTQLKTMTNIGNRGSHAQLPSFENTQALLLLIKDFIKQNPL